MLLALPAKGLTTGRLLLTSPTPTTTSKDILRAFGMRLLPVDNPHVKSGLAKSRSAKLFSSIMLVSGDLTTGVPLINRGIAPGYGRRRLSWRSGQRHEALGAVNLPIAKTATESATRTTPREQARNCRQSSTHAHRVQRCSPAQLSQQLVGPSRL
jgi:hypothetical protein